MSKGTQATGLSAKARVREGVRNSGTSKYAEKIRKRDKFYAKGGTFEEWINRSK